MPAEEPERVIDDVGRRIREVRRARGWTQQDTAERLGMPLKDFQSIERGVRNITLKTLVQLASGLGVPTRALFDPPASRESRHPGRPRAHGPIELPYPPDHTAGRTDARQSRPTTTKKRSHRAT